MKHVSSSNHLPQVTRCIGCYAEEAAPVRSAWQRKNEERHTIHHGLSVSLGGKSLRLIQQQQLLSLIFLIKKKITQSDFFDGDSLPGPRGAGRQRGPPGARRRADGDNTHRGVLSLRWFWAGRELCQRLWRRNTSNTPAADSTFKLSVPTVT